MGEFEVENRLPERDGVDAGVAGFLGVVAFDDEPLAGGGLGDVDDEEGDVDAAGGFGGEGRWR